MQSFPVVFLTLWWIYNCHFSKTVFSFSQLQLFQYFINLICTKLTLLFGSRKKTLLMYKTSFDVTVSSRIALWKIILQIFYYKKLQMINNGKLIALASWIMSKPLSLNFWIPNVYLGMVNANKIILLMR